MFFRAVAEREGHKVALEVIIAPHRALFGYDEQLLVLRPAERFDCAFVPLYTSVSPTLHLQAASMRPSCGDSYIDGPYQFPRAAVDVDAGLRCLRSPVGNDLGLIAVYCCTESVSPCHEPKARQDRTYSAAVRSPYNVVVLKLEILVENGRVELDFAVELVAELLPVRRGLRHVMRRGVSWTTCRGSCGRELEA